MAIGWTEETCLRMDALAAQDHSYVATPAERKRYEKTWGIMKKQSKQQYSTYFRT